MFVAVLFQAQSSFQSTGDKLDSSEKIEMNEIWVFCKTWLFYWTKIAFEISQGCKIEKFPEK